MNSLLIILFAFSLFQDNHPCTEYKTETNYLIQELTYGYGADHYPPFACFYRLKTDYNLYYITDEDYLLNAITADSINLDSLTYLVPHFSDWDIFDSVQDKYTNRVCFSKAL